MNFLFNLFCCFYSKSTYIDSSVNVSKFNSAGVLFTDDTYVLAGSQNIKKTLYISGIGGKKENNETYMDTALREMVEEIFDIQPSHIDLELLKKKFKPKMVFQVKTYITVVYTFIDLQNIANFLNNRGFQSRLYNIFPLSVDDIVKERITCFNTEIYKLHLIEFAKRENYPKTVHTDFIHDLVKYKAIQKKQTNTDKKKKDRKYSIAKVHPLQN
jgi:hypothetical protein